jgi:hypothetical protein
MAVRKINFYLDTLSVTPDHQRLFGYMDKLMVMQRIFLKIAPPQLAQHCILGGFFEGNLTICANNGAIAAKLRQTVPSLLLKFQARGYEVTAIRIAVQANYHALGVNKLSAKKPRLGQTGADSLKDLAEGLPPSPLKSAIESLAKKQTDK